MLSSFGSPPLAKFFHYTSPLHFREDAPPPGIPLAWGSEVSTGLGTSSPTETTQSSALIHMCQAPQTSLCTLFG